LCGPSLSCHSSAHGGALKKETVKKMVRSSLLAFITLTSKSFIIFNEEVLVLLSFLAFFATCQINLQETVKEVFQARRDGIQVELQNYLIMKEGSFGGFSNEYGEQNGLRKTVQQLGTFSCREVFLIGEGRETSLLTTCKAQVQQKLRSLWSVGQAFQLEIQKTLAGGLRGVVLEKFNRLKRSLKIQLVKQALRVLRKAGK
jgi:hypothetical protein